MIANKTIAEQIIEFNKQLQYIGDLPNGFQVLNPYLENPETLVVMQKFYTKYYNDVIKRKFIIGINPSRHGAGVTGVPFTDTKRLEQVCGITMKSAHTHEISSVFLYDMIKEFGGTDVFYKNFYINSPFPLAIVQRTKESKWINANYYDDKNLFAMVKPFMIESLKKHISLGVDTTNVFVLGKKNATFIEKINKEEHLFENLTILDHPRYIQQYKSRDRDLYINKYIGVLGS